MRPSRLPDADEARSSTGGAGFIGSTFVRAAPRGHGRRASPSSTSSRTPATRPTSTTRSPRPGDAATGSGSSRATSPTPPPCASWSATTTRSSTSRPNRTSTARSSSRPPSCTPASSASTRSWRRVRAEDERRAGRARLCASSRSAPTRSTARCRWASAARTIRCGRPARTAPPRRPASISCAPTTRRYGTDVVITRGANTYGPRQYPEKLIPLFVTNALRRRAAADLRRRHAATRLAVRRRPCRRRGRRARSRRERIGLQRAGRRGRAAQPGGHRGHPRGAREALVARPQRARPARARPSLRARRQRACARSAGSRASPFEEGIGRTVRWYAEHRAWWERRRDTEFRAYYERQYAWRLERSAQA